MSDMGKFNIELPPHAQAYNRGKYFDIYFIVKKRIRPEGWKPSIKIGRSDQMSTHDIIDKANRIYDEFLRFKAASHGIQVDYKTGTIPHVIRIYKTSDYFAKLSMRTREDYERMLRIIDQWSAKNGHPHIRTMTRKNVFKFLDSFRDQPRKQKYVRSVLSVLMNAALREDLIDQNIVNDIKLSYKKVEKKKLILWDDQAIEAFFKTADQMGFISIGRALVFAYETGQRRGDVLRMQQPRDYNNGILKFRQSKTGQLVNIPTTDYLKSVLGKVPRSQLLLFACEYTGKKWKEDSFAHKFREIAIMAGLKKHEFRFTRHTAVLRLARSGCTKTEIASITGHSLASIEHLLANHYLETKDPVQAENAIIKLENYSKSLTKKSNKLSNKSVRKNN